MSIFNIFRRKKPLPIPVQNPEPKRIEDLQKEIFGARDMTDYLGKAAMSEQKGLAAIKEKKFDKAWEIFHKQKNHYMGHANRSEFSPNQALALDASVSANLANILRLESKHIEAFEHILYWASTSSTKTKTQQQKLKAYFNRAKIGGLSLDEVNEFISSRKNKDFKAIRSWVANRKK